MYSKDYIGAEVFFPKGNKNSANVKIDVCIFDDKNWFDYYKKWHNQKDYNSLDWLQKHLIFTIEVKKEDSNGISDVYSFQLKPYMQISQNDSILGAIYDTGRLFLFKKIKNNIIRFDETLNKKGEESKPNELSLDLFDSYNKFPSFEQLNNNNIDIDKSKRTIEDLDIISGTNNQILKDNISKIVQVMDRQSLNNQRGYEILIQMIALKIFDEKRNTENYLKFYETKNERTQLSFYIKENEKNFLDLDDVHVREFIERMQKLYEDASAKYKHILKKQSTETISWITKSHIIIIGEIVYQLQDYSFIKSKNNDLYQLVFYKFANEFAKTENAQFVTPLDIIEFLTNIINPKQNESIIDPTVGIADFLAIAYLNSNKNLDDRNLFGVDNNESMIMLSQLNMLLNGDGNANLKWESSITHKFNKQNELVKLKPNIHKNGNWEEWNDQNSLKKFDIVLTNPPFGKNRSYTEKDIGKDTLELYELWNLMKKPKNGTAKIDPGLIFLENAYHILKENGRLGIVLSNSIAGVKSYEFARKWLIDNMRIVALFDLPERVFADTDVNTTLIIAYKPSKENLKKLQANNYQVFAKKIKKIGYKVMTKDRVSYFDYIFKEDDDYNYLSDAEGNLIKDEEFTETIEEFRKWLKTQEEDLNKIFGD